MLGMAGEWWKLMFEKPSRHPFPERDADILAALDPGAERLLVESTAG